MTYKYLTPDTSELGAVCRSLQIAPNLFHLLLGQIDIMTDPDMYEQHGSMTPQEVADEFQNVYESYLTGTCEGSMIGEIKIWPTDSIPTGWLLCNGSLHLPTTYPDLYDVIGFTYGSGMGRFRLPDYRQRYIRGRDAAVDGDIATEKGLAVQDVPAAAIPQHTHEWYNPVDLPSVDVVKYTGSGTIESVAKVAVTPLVDITQSDAPTTGITMEPRTMTLNFIIYAGDAA